MTEGMPLFALSEEHLAIREAVRAVCDAKVAPAAERWLPGRTIRA